PSSGEPGAPGRLELDGWAPQSTGGVALPVHVVALAVPPRGAVHLDAQGLDEVELPHVALAPDTGMALPGGTLAPGSPDGPTAPAPAGVARLLSVGWLRNQRVARIEIRPARFDPTRSALRVARPVDVRPAFGA